MNSPHYYSRYREYFLHFGSFFPFLLNRLSTFLFLIKPLLTPNSASPSRKLFSVRDLTSLLCESNSYSTSSAMFETGIMRLFRSNCPRGVQKRILANQEHDFPTPLGKDDSKHLLSLVLHLRFIRVFIHCWVVKTYVWLYIHDNAIYLRWSTIK